MDTPYFFSAYVKKNGLLQVKTAYFLYILHIFFIFFRTFALKVSTLIQKIAEFGVVLTVAFLLFL